MRSAYILQQNDVELYGNAANVYIYSNNNTAMLLCDNTYYMNLNSIKENDIICDELFKSIGVSHIL